MEGIRHVPNNDLPIIGPWISRAGQVRAMMATPCTIEPEVWVLAGFHSLPMLVWSLFKPDAFDMTTERLGRKHKKHRKRRFKFGGLIFDEEFEKGKGKLRWAVFSLGQLAERIGWWMLIIDASTELAVHWTSTAYTWSGCPTPQGAAAKTACSDMRGSVSGGSDVFAGWNAVYAQAPLTAAISRIFVPPGRNSVPMLNFEITDPPAPWPRSPSIQVHLMDLKSGTIYESFDFSDPTKPAKGRGVYMNPGYFNPERQWGIRIDWAPGYFWIKGELTVVSEQPYGIDFDP